MIAICEVIAIEPVQEIEFSDHSRHSVQNVWVKSADEDLQGNWTTFVKLYDDDVRQNENLRVGDTVSVSVFPTNRRLNSGNVVQSVILKLVGVARA